LISPAEGRLFFIQAYPKIFKILLNDIVIPECLYRESMSGNRRFPIKTLGNDKYWEITPDTSIRL